MCAPPKRPLAVFQLVGSLSQYKDPKMKLAEGLLVLCSKEAATVPVPKKLLMTASIHDGYTSARGRTATLGSFAKTVFDAIFQTYSSSAL